MNSAFVSPDHRSALRRALSWPPRSVIFVSSFCVLHVASHHPITMSKFQGTWENPQLLCRWGEPFSPNSYLLKCSSLAPHLSQLSGVVAWLIRTILNYVKASRWWLPSFGCPQILMYPPHSLECHLKGYETSHHSGAFVREGKKEEEEREVTVVWLSATVLGNQIQEGLKQGSALLPALTSISVKWGRMAGAWGFRL